MATASVWLARVLFLGLFLVGFGMLWRAWKIHFRRDDRHVADARGRRFPQPARWRVPVAAVHGLAGAALLTTGVLVLPLGLPLTVWTGLGGLTLWLFVMILQGLARRARAEAGPT